MLAKDSRTEASPMAGGFGDGGITITSTAVAEAAPRPAHNAALPPRPSVAALPRDRRARIDAARREQRVRRSPPASSRSVGRSLATAGTS